MERNILHANDPGGCARHSGSRPRPIRGVRTGGGRLPRQAHSYGAAILWGSNADTEQYVISFVYEIGVCVTAVVAATCPATYAIWERIVLPKPALRIATGKLSGLAILLVMWLLSAAAPSGGPDSDPDGVGDRRRDPGCIGPGPARPDARPHPPAAADQLPDDGPEGAEGAPPAEAGGQGQEAVAPEAPDLAKPQAPEPHADPAGDPAEALRLRPRSPSRCSSTTTWSRGPTAATAAIISTEEFAAQMAWLKANGFPPSPPPSCWPG